ncbi:MAG: PDZ domain-containing protein, partial [Oscillibacter sp.]|nr:PDZ domain-containing protein [Oscillibacter sp.]
PAERAGVQVGDYIIAADSETVSSSRDLLRVRRRYHVGDDMPLTLWRDGERVEVLISFTE